MWEVKLNYIEWRAKLAIRNIDGMKEDGDSARKILGYARDELVYLAYRSKEFNLPNDIDDNEEEIKIGGTD